MDIKAPIENNTFLKMGDVPKKRKKKTKISTRTAAKETFLEFCSSTSVHGVQYIGVRKRFDR